MTVQSVSRFDLAKINSSKLTPHGFLHAPARLTRAGVFEYIRDGKTVRELRPASEVFDGASLESLRDAPVVVDHPKELWVTSRNAKALAVGWVGSVDRTDSFVEGPVTIIDQDTITQVQNGLQHFSLGYTCDLDPTSGHDPEHGQYDSIQRNIRYNHAALVRPEQNPRAGLETRLRLDAQGEVSSDLGAVLTNDNGSGNTDQDNNMRLDKGDLPMDIITINGVDFEAPKNTVQAVRAELERLNAPNPELEKLQGRFDAQSAKLKEAEKALEDALDQARFDAAVAEQVDLITKARKVLGDECEVKGTRREVMDQVLRHASQDLDLSDKTDDYVEARFDALLESWSDQQAADSKRRVRADAHRSTSNGAEQTEEAARKRMMENNAKMGCQPFNAK